MLDQIVTREGTKEGLSVGAGTGVMDVWKYMLARVVGGCCDDAGWYMSAVVPGGSF